MNVKLTQEQKIKVLNTTDVYNIMQQILLREKKIDRDKEHFWTVCLATNNRILFIELISLGSVNATIVEPMDVFSFALQKRAVKLIMVHNHPSGELTPSMSDIEMTDKMMAIGKFINLPVLDRLIISETSFFSFNDSGLMNRIRAKTTYDLSFKDIDQLKVEAGIAGEMRAREIVRKLLLENLPIELIERTTGLSTEQINSITATSFKKDKRNDA